MGATSIFNKSFKSAYLFLRFIIIFICIISNVYANQIDSKKYTGGGILGAQLTLEITNPPTLDYKVEDSKLYIKIGIGDLYKLGASNDFSLTLKLKVYEDNGVGLNEMAVLEDIVLNNANPEAIYAYNYSNAPDELEKVGIFIENISDWNDVSPILNVQNYIKSNITVELTSEIDYRIDVRKQEKPVVPILNTFNEVELTNRYQIFSWNDNTPDNFPNYQFEILRLYNDDIQLAGKVKEIATTIDWSKALRIETQSSTKQLALTIAEGTGFYVWRVRPIGTFYEGGIADNRNWGEWSYAPAQGERIINLSISDISAPFYFYFTDPDDEKNWIYSRTFSENNRLSEQISYANGLQQLRQSQTYLNSKDTSLITQTILDFSGRPSLTTIPVPVQGGIQPYKSQLVTANGNLYKAEDFDKDNMMPAQVDSNDVYSYYSDINLNTTIPSAQGYPFTRLVYANDPTGRVIEQAGAGKRHAIGKQSDGMGRTTRTIYGNPSEEELIRIFGDEAPRADAVLKTTTIDPNNQASVTYITKEGNVIATCLVVNENENMEEIDGYNLIENIINTRTTRNVFTGDKFVSSKNLTLSKETELSIVYNIDCKLLKLPCKEAAGNCMYKLQFLLVNLETKDIYRSNTFDVCNGVRGYDLINEVDGPWIWSKDNAESSDLSAVNNKINLSAGKYMISKIVSVGATEETFEVVEAFKESKLVIRPLTDVIHNWLNNVKREEDMIRFYEVVKEFGDAISSKDLEAAKLCYDDILGGVTIVDEFVLNENHFIFFDQDYIPETATEDAKLPRVLIIQGGCCGDIKIPVIYLPPIECYTVEEMMTDASKRPDFWNYFIDALYVPYKEVLNDQDWYVSAIEPMPTEGKDLLAGYDLNKLNTMVYYMVTDTYKIGNKEDEPAQVQYTCNEVWEAWQSIINSTNDILSNMAAIKPVSVEEGAKEEDEANETDGDSKDDHMNDDDSADMPGGFIMRWILKKSMSKRVDDFENVTTDSSTPVDLDFDIVSQFLKQVGYKFAAIVETYDDVLPIDLNGDPDYDGKKDPLGVNNILYDEIEVCNLSDSCLDNLPYIKNPVYAFKYFQYDDEEEIGRPRYYQVEIQHCYNPQEAYSDKIGVGILCDYNCPYHHDQWDYKKRYRFYQDLVNYKLPEYDPADDEFPEDATIGGKTFDEVLAEEAYAYFDSLKTCDICRNEEKLSTIRRYVEQTFIDNCYTIGGCPTDENVVLPEDIDQILNEIQTNCLNNCNGIFIGDESVNPDPENPVYPKEVKVSCWTLNEDAISFDEQIEKLTFKILPEQEWEQYLSLKNWEVAFALDDTHSLCECMDDFSGNILSSEWHTIDKDSRNATDLYPYYYQLNFDIKSQLEAVEDEFVGIWTEEIKGNFDISIKIMSHKSENNDSRVGLFAAIDTSNLSELGDQGDITLSVSKSNEIVLKHDGTVVNTVNVVDISSSVYWLRLVKNTADGKFYAFYKLNEEDLWEDQTPINPGGTDGPIASDYKIGIYAEGLQGFTDPETNIKYPGKAIFDDFNCGKLLPNQMENNEWIGGADSENFYYPE